MMNRLFCLTGACVLVACADNDPFDPTNTAGNDADFDAVGVDVIIPPPEVPTCDDTCDERYATRCTGESTIEVCDDFNADGCVEWGDNRPCQPGYVCEGDVCLDPNTPPVTMELQFTTDEDTPLTAPLSATDPDEQRLRFELTSRPTNGALSGVVPALTYIPDAHFNGTDEFTFTVTDRLSAPVSGRVVITVNPVNDLPVFNAARFNLTEDVPLDIALQATDVDEDTLTWEFLDTPTLVTLEGEGPDFTVVPNPNAFGDETLRFRVDDGSGLGEPVELSLRIAPVNDAPVGSAQSVSVNEDAELDITVAANDVDSEDIDILLALPPAHGTLVPLSAPGAWTYIPDENYFGPDQYSYAIDDGRLTSSSYIVSINVVPVEDPPTAGVVALVTPEDTAGSITLQGQDVDLQPLTFAVTVPPAYGALTGSGRSFVYTPGLNFAGSDVLTYTVSDGTSTPATGAVNITVTPVNDPPTLTGATLVLEENTSVTFLAVADDVETADLQFVVETPTSNGAISGTPPNLRYTPEPDFFGTDTLVLAVVDESGARASATFTFDVRPVGVGPTITSTSFTVVEDTPRTLQLTANDPDTSADDLAWQLVTPPTRGILTGTPPELNYAPNSNAIGFDSFTVSVNDGIFGSGNVTVQINITPVNDAPIALDDEFTIDEDDFVDFVLRASDIDADPITYEIVSPVGSGALTGSGPNRRFTPTPNSSGTFRFTWRAFDGTVASTIARTTIRVNPINDPPVISTDAVRVDEDLSTSGTITGVDVESSPLTWRLADAPDHGELTGVLPDFTYTPDANYFGPDSVTVIANDGTSDSNTLVVPITINGVNDAPTVTSVEVVTDEDTAVAVIIDARDVDGDPLTIVPITAFSLGNLSGGATGGTYTPVLNRNGVDVLEFRVSDGLATSNPATVTVRIDPVADRPVINNTSVFLDEDTSAPFTLTATDGDGDPLSYRVGAVPAGVSIALDPNAGTGEVTLDPNVNGTFTVQVFASDGVLESTAGSLGITVNRVNDAPTVQSQQIFVSEDVFADVDLVGNDVDGDDLAFRVSRQPANGTITGTAPNLTYTPDEDFFGADSFEVIANDGTVDSLPGTIEFEIQAINDPPVGTPRSIEVYAGRSFAGTLAATDVENDRTLLFLPGSAPDEGTVSIARSGTFTYTADAGGARTDSFTFFVKESSTPSTFFTCTAGGTIPADWECDGQADCADSSDEPLPRCETPERVPIVSDPAATVSVNILPPPPITAADDAMPYYGNTPVTITQAWLLENDTDILSRTRTLSSASPATTGGGTVQLSGANLVYTPPTSNPLTDTWNYTVTTDDGVSDTATLTFNRLTTVHYFQAGAAGGGTGVRSAPRNALPSGTIGADGDIIMILNPSVETTALTGTLTLRASQRVLGELIGLPPLTAFGRTVQVLNPAALAPRVLSTATAPFTSAVTASLGTITIAGLRFDGDTVANAVGGLNLDMTGTTVNLDRLSIVDGSGIGRLNFTATSTLNLNTISATGFTSVGLRIATSGANNAFTLNAADVTFGNSGPAALTSLTLSFGTGSANVRWEGLETSSLTQIALGAGANADVEFVGGTLRGATANAVTILSNVTAPASSSVVFQSDDEGNDIVFSGQTCLELTHVTDGTTEIIVDGADMTNCSVSAIGSAGNSDLFVNDAQLGGATTNIVVTMGSGASLVVENSTFSNDFTAAAVRINNTAPETAYVRLEDNTISAGRSNGAPFFLANPSSGVGGAGINFVLNNNTSGSNSAASPVDINVTVNSTTGNNRPVCLQGTGNVLRGFRAAAPGPVPLTIRHAGTLTNWLTVLNTITGTPTTSGTVTFNPTASCYTP